jgi:TRAP-type mannitol/chloroaromatic compound transport system permease small subunit
MAENSFLKVLDGISEWSGRIFVWLTIPMTVLVVYEVISRRFFDMPHVWATEVIDFIYGPHFMLCAAYTLLHKAHVNIDILYQRFTPRIRGVLDVIGHLVFFFPFCIIVLYEGIIFAGTSWSIGETSESAALRILPLIKTAIPLAFLLILNQGVAVFIRSILQAVRGREV